MRSIVLSLVFGIITVPLLTAGIAVREEDSGKDTVQYLISRADLIVAAVVTSDAFSMGSAPIDNAALYPRPYLLNANIETVFHGTPPKISVLYLSVSRIESGRDPISSDLKKGGKFIFFLKHRAGERPEWVGADPWFGAMPYTAGLAAALTGKLNKQGRENAASR